ncbi:hypothetical protein B0T26DRAFT_815215 [Lasiosphaeria miniovina]|uniref:T6SS Phospholipase effector Tle1-like catalytic domain-containing protein n=1 Tax=Lasiosphaeria miniovina TaxID=1954250 RepID=A0AA40A0M1_9PEZI|nr:uncharacterized protein B0T26DRAFT_815215 [Lasiosphaeria miniovina]KAK0707054.1 hypothetical protein B0T26DRAFT_815215 [Lasiosphaeria miniovina]
MAQHEHEIDSQALAVAREIKKRLFVLCDGTWQDGVNKTRPLTNVATLARCLTPIDNDGCLQVVYYDSGIGNASGALSKVVDGAFGRGISAKIRNAYSFLSHNWNFDRRDETVLIGFSRGAFAVQCLASFISDAGLLKKHHLYYLRGLFTLWAKQEVLGGRERFQKERQRLINSEVLRHPVDITALAVWDTVGALGSPFQLHPRSLAFVGKVVPAQVRHAFHALALDEERAKFKPLVWEPTDGGDGSESSVSQCWFLGSHGDVGGNGDAALGAVSLLWMVGKLNDEVRVSFDENQIAKHLKHKYLEWDFSVNKLRRTFKETRRLSDMRQSGLATRQAWYWWLLGRGPRSESLLSSASLPSEIHFTIRLAMATNKNQCHPLESWTTSWTRLETVGKDRIQWQSQDGRQKLNEHPLRPPRRANRQKPGENPLQKEDKESYLLDKWSRRAFGNSVTDRSEFVALEATVQVKKAEKVLLGFASFLKEHMKFTDDEKLSEAVLYHGAQQAEAWAVC